MKLFRKKNKDKELHPFIQRVLVRMNQKLLSCAAYLQRKTNQYSRHTCKIILLIFCTVFVSASIIIIVNSLQRKNPVAYIIEPIQFIRLKDKVLPSVFRGDELRKILRFKHYLDSNKIFRDSLLAGRPHLMDSINLIEKMYQNK